MADNGTGATTVLRAYGVLSGIMADAVKGKRLAANPTRGCGETAPQDGPTPRPTWRPTTCIGWPTRPDNIGLWC
jgi:hypothetical protein